MKYILVIAFALTSFSALAGTTKKSVRLQLAAVGFAKPSMTAPKAESIPEAKVERIEFPANLPEVEIPSDKEIASTCNTAYLSCMRAGSSFERQCRTVERECLSPSAN